MEESKEDGLNIKESCDNSSNTNQLDNESNGTESLSSESREGNEPEKTTEAKSNSSLKTSVLYNASEDDEVDDLDTVYTEKKKRCIQSRSSSSSPQENKRARKPHTTPDRYSGEGFECAGVPSCSGTQPDLSTLYPDVNLSIADTNINEKVDNSYSPEDKAGRDNLNAVYIKTEIKCESLDEELSEDTDCANADRGSDNICNVNTGSNDPLNMPVSYPWEQPEKLDKQTIRGQIIGLRAFGWPIRRIADHLGIDKNTAMKWIHRFSNGLGIRNTVRVKNTPRKTTPEQDQQIIDFIVANPNTTAVTIRKELDLPVCSHTVRKRLHESGLKPIVVKQQPDKQI